MQEELDASLTGHKILEEANGMNGLENYVSIHEIVAASKLILYNSLFLEIKRYCCERYYSNGLMKGEQTSGIFDAVEKFNESQ